METAVSFAPLAGRLAAHAAEFRPLDGARDTWAKFAALVICLVLDMLIYLCEALDARAAAELRSAEVTASASRAEHLAGSGNTRTHSPRLARVVRAIAPSLDTKRSNKAEVPRLGPWLAWSRDADPVQVMPGVAVAGRSRKTAFQLAPTHVNFVAIS